MTTRRKRNARQRIAEFYDDCAYAFDRHKEAFFGGFALGVFCVLMAFYFVTGLTGD